MSFELVGRFEPDSPQWHAARAFGLGGSEIAAVLGLSPYTSHYSLWLQKAGVINDPTVITPPMEAGNRLERVILDWWGEQRDDLDLMPAGTYRSTERPWQIANPDGLAGKVGPKSLAPDSIDAIVEAKFALYDYDWGKSGSDEIPAHYLCQTQWYMDVLGVDVCYVPVFIGSSGEFREYVVRANYADQQLMRDAGAAFMASLSAGERPSLDDHDATYRAVRLEHPGIDREASVELVGTLWADYLDAKESAETATSLQRLFKTQILDAMGDARLATVGGEPVLRRQPGRGGAVSLQPVRTSRSAA